MFPTDVTAVSSATKEVPKTFEEVPVLPETRNQILCYEEQQQKIASSVLLLLPFLIFAFRHSVSINCERKQEESGLKPFILLEGLHKAVSN